MKKRSLFVATAMLLVAVLVATGATYAWFTSTDGTASTEIQMGVSKSSKLEMHSANMANGAWTQELDATDLFGAATQVWNDYTTTADNIKLAAKQFQNEIYNEETGKASVNPETMNIATSVMVTFRSTEPGDVFVKADTAVFDTTTIESGKADNIGNAARVAFCSASAADAAADTSAIFFGDANSPQTADYVAADATEKVTVVKMSEDLVDGYYVGYAWVHCWLEGTDETNCLGSYANLADKIQFECTFAQK